MNEPTPTHVKEAAEEICAQAFPGEAYKPGVSEREVEEIIIKHLPQPSEEKMIKYSDGKEYRLIDVLAGLANQLTPYAYDLNPRLVKETNEALAVWRDRKFLLPQPPEQKEKV